MADATIKVVQNRAVVSVGGAGALLSSLAALISEKVDADGVASIFNGKVVTPYLRALLATSGLTTAANLRNEIGAASTDPATTLVSGLIKIATDEEAMAGEVASEAITPAQAKAVVQAATPDATIVTRGQLRIASDEEAAEGVVISEAMTPKTTKMVVAARVDPINEVLDPIAEAVDPTDDGVFRIKGEDGGIIAEIDPEKGLSVAGMRLTDTEDDGFTVMTEDGGILISTDLLVETGDGGISMASATRIIPGAPTDSGFLVSADIVGDGPGLARVVVSRDTDFTDRSFVSAEVAPLETQKAGGEVWRTVKIAVADLRPDTSYHWRVEVDGTPGEARTLTTLPRRGQPAAFRFAFGSCSNITVGAMPALEAAAEDGAAFFLHLGDITYSDIATDLVTDQRAKNLRAFMDTASAQALAATTPLVYVPDDHDTSVDDCHWDEVYSDPAVKFINVSAANRQAYRESMPHYPLANSDLLTQMFDVAQARFIVLDTRTQARFAVGTKTCLGHVSGHEYWDQLSWFYAQLTAAGEAGIKRLFVASPRGWTGSDYDGWQQRFAAEQTAICNFIRDTPGIPALTLLTGDFHRAAVDDGTNTDKATGGGCAIAQIMSSPILRTATLSGGGPFSWMGADSQFLGQPQVYALVDVDEDGEWTVQIIGAPYNATTKAGTVLGTFSSLDDTPAVQFASSTASGPASQPKALSMTKSWFGPVGGSSVAWSTNNGQSGVVEIGPNTGKLTFDVVAPASGSITVTLASPLGCELGAQTTLSLSAA